jgi:hypothetical protein
MSVDVETVKQTVGEGGGFFSNRRNVILTAGAIGVGIGGIIFLTRRSSPGDGNSSKMADLSGLPIFVNSLAEQLMRFRGEQSIAEADQKKRDEGLSAQIGSVGQAVTTSETNVLQGISASTMSVQQAMALGNQGIKDAISSGNQRVIDFVSAGNQSVRDAISQGDQRTIDFVSSSNAWYWSGGNRPGAGGFEYMNPLDWLRAGKPFADPTVAYLPSDYTDDQLDAGDGSGAQWFTIISANKPTRRAAFHG